jgi:peptidoglycan/LPS O-acetylase OafA/YrhL
MSLLTNNPISREMSRDRVYGLDIIRAYAIILAMIGHAGLLMPVRFQVFQYRYIIWLDALDLFFVLSGFLIGRILIDTFEREELSFNTLKHFWYKRWLRTLPAYFFMLSLLAWLYQVQGKKMLLKYFLFIQNFNTPQPDWFVESFSLSIEEWFYLLTPLLVFLVMKVFRVKTLKAFITVALTVVIAFPLYRWYKFIQVTPFDGHRAWEFLFRMQVTTRLDSIMYGVIGACLFKYYRHLWDRYKNISLVVGICIIGVSRILDYYFIGREGVPSNYYSSIFSFSMECFGDLLILPFFSNIKRGKGKVRNFVTFMSIISYSSYLVNFTLVAFYIMGPLPHMGLSDRVYLMVRYMGTLLLSTTLAVLLYITVEYPFLLLRNKLEKKRRNKLAYSPQPVLEPVEGR